MMSMATGEEGRISLLHAFRVRCDYRAGNPYAVVRGSSIVQKSNELLTIK